MCNEHESNQLLINRFELKTRSYEYLSLKVNKRYLFNYLF